MLTLYTNQDPAKQGWNRHQTLKTTVDNLPAYELEVELKTLEKTNSPTVFKASGKVRGKTKLWTKKEFLLVCMRKRIKQEVTYWTIAEELKALGWSPQNQPKQEGDILLLSNKENNPFPQAAFPPYWTGGKWSSLLDHYKNLDLIQTV
jgi:hypothetical protein